MLFSSRERVFLWEGEGDPFAVIVVTVDEAGIANCVEDTFRSRGTDELALLFQKDFFSLVPK